MSRIYGFLGGALTTLSVAYLTACEFHKNADKVKSSLKDSKQVIDSMHKPPPAPIKTINYESRNNISETVKDLWNMEVIKGVNWLYSWTR